MNQLTRNLRALADAFEVQERRSGVPGDETFVALRSDHPEWMQSAVFNAHSGMLPSDLVYRDFMRVAKDLAERAEYFEDPTREDLEDEASEIADSLVDVYNHDRLTWAKECPLADEYVTEALEAFGHPTGADDGLIGILGMGQYVYFMELVRVVLAAADEAEPE